MGFQLTIAQGKEAGKQIGFDQNAITIGRTEECDLILYEPGVSRKHCRISLQGGGYVLEDLGSSNGTKVNGTRITAPQSLKDGDAVGVGAVVLNFFAEDEATVMAPTEAPAIAEQHTRIVQASDVRRTKASVPARPSTRTASLLAEPTDPEHAALPPPDSEHTVIKAAPARPTSAGAGLARAASAAPVRSTSAAPAPARPTRAAAGPSGGAGLSAAERARMRREARSALDRARLVWVEASPEKRKALMAGGGAGLLLLVGLLAWGLVALVSSGPTQSEPSVLTGMPIEQTFGYGDGVTFERPDKKLFTYSFNSSVKAVAILHYQARDISEAEVTISVNGAVVGNVPADTLASEDRTLELVIPSTLLRKGEKNTILFDNVHNPPNRDSWRIWNLWMETAPLPDLPPDQLLANAQDAFHRGLDKFDGKDIDKRNRYTAWKDFRAAWLLLEGYPDPKPELYRLAKERMEAAQRELDSQCSKLLLEAERDYNEHNFAATTATLNDVKEWFPSKDQPCQFRAELKREQFNL